ncbi:hypothetical protein [Nonomuraea sediminis]|uniref:hypothetical protein n=1 Tax=Nonomuraea sediminis TaxID=2835864 RepID=UPI001BDC795A|nr:hypothetical protein [Nonomuraea sediminis]
MDRFFRRLTRYDRQQPEAVAKSYAAYFWDKKKETLKDRESIGKYTFDVGLGVRRGDFATLTRRVSLISDTLLLSDDWAGDYHEIGKYRSDEPNLVDAPTNYFPLAAAARKRDGYAESWNEDYFGVQAPDLDRLGTWILEAEPLMRAGLAWYLPSYCTRTQRMEDGRTAGKPQPVKHKSVIDFFIRGRRAIEASGGRPVKSRFVRPVLEMHLPFIDGVGLRDFSKITVEEFGSYQAFRDFLRLKLMDLDKAHDSVQSELDLLRIGAEIREQIRASEAEMAKVRAKRAVAASGAVLGTVGATLVAVYGAALQPALAVLGATGGIWGVIHAINENSIRTVRNDKWYYVWSLARAARRD